MSITPKRTDIENKVLPESTIETLGCVDYDDKEDLNIINIYKNDKNYTLLASYKFTLPAQVPPEIYGIMQGLVVARLATEALVNINHTCKSPIPFNFDTLLSKYGMANVTFNTTLYKPNNTTSTDNTLMFSGGADSSHILFSRLQGNCNLISFSHGQSNYRAGVHSEHKASLMVPELMRAYTGYPINQSFASSRWKSYLPRRWAKAYRNLMFMTQAAAYYPDTNIIIGTSKDDRLHDSFPDFIEGYSKTTGINVVAPNLHTGRDVIMHDLIEVSRNYIPYYYASTSSCQLQRYTAKKYLQEGSCHSCILRLPAAVYGGDPRFIEYDPTIKLIPQYLEGSFDATKYYKRKPSINALKTFFSDLGTEDDIFKDFAPTVKLVESDWSYAPKKFLTKEQLDIYG